MFDRFDNNKFKFAKDFTEYATTQKAKYALDYNNIVPKPIDFESVRVRKKALIISNLQKDKIESYRDRIVSVFSVLLNLKYKVRVQSNIDVRYIEYLKDAGYTNIKMVSSFNRDHKKYQRYLRFKYSIDVDLIYPSQTNLEAAAYYIGNFTEKTDKIKYLMASSFCAAFGPYNNDGLELLITLDEYFNFDTINYEKSKSTAGFYWMFKTFRNDYNINIYNIIDDKHVSDLKSLLKIVSR